MKQLIKLKWSYKFYINRITTFDIAFCFSASDACICNLNDPHAVHAFLYEGPDENIRHACNCVVNP